MPIKPIKPNSLNNFFNLAQPKIIELLHFNKIERIEFKNVFYTKLTGWKEGILSTPTP